MVWHSSLIPSCSYSALRITNFQFNVLFSFHFIFFLSFFLISHFYLQQQENVSMRANVRASVCVGCSFIYVHMCVCVWPTQVAGTVACLLATAFSMSLISWAYHLNCSVCSRLWVQFSEIDDSPGAIAFLFVVNNTQTHTHTPWQA